MRRTLLILTCTGLAMLAIAGDAFAQRREGGGRGSGSSFSGGAGRGAYYAPRYGNSYYGRGGYYRGGYYRGYGYGSGYYQPYLGAGILGAAIIANSYYNSMPYYYGVNPGAYSYPAPVNARQSFYAGPANQQQPATMTVIVPTADAQVWFEDAPTNQRGTARTFASPPLEAGYNYTYTIKTHWVDNGQPIDRTREVNIQAGQAITVNMNAITKETLPVPAFLPRLTLPRD